MTQQSRSTFISTVNSTITDGGLNTAAEVRSMYANSADSSFFPLTDTSDVITQGSTNLFLTSAERTILSNTSGTNTGDQTSVTGNAGTATALQTARTIGGVSFDGTANIVPQTIQMVNDAADTTCFIMFGNASGTVSQQPKTNTTLTFNASTGILAATGFSGPLTGNVTGNVSGSSGSTTGNAATATALATPRNIGGVAFNGTADVVPTTIVVADTTSATCHVGLWEAATGSLLPKTDNGIRYNATSGLLTATAFAGPLTGDVTGNAATATALQTARTINGTSFNGTANITVTAAAGTLTGTTLNATVVTSSLTAVGTITSGTWNGTTIAVARGGTGATTLTGILKGNGTSAFTAATAETDYVTPTGTGTLSSKRITPRVTTTASSSTPTPDADASDLFTVTALAAGAVFAAPTGTPVNGQALIVRIKDNGTARTLGWNAIYRAVGITLPTTTVLGKTLYLGMIYNSADTKWDVIGLSQEA